MWITGDNSQLKNYVRNSVPVSDNIVKLDSITIIMLLSTVLSRDRLVLYLI